MLRDLLSKWYRAIARHTDHSLSYSLVKTYQAISSASVDELWHKVINLGDVSWHPILWKTNVPYGLIAKPGIMYQAFIRRCPIPIQMFVERVSPREVLSIRILAIPGIEERVTYEVESTLCGTRILYSVTLRGCLSPLVWSILQPYAERVASRLAQAAEQAALEPAADKAVLYQQDGCFDF